MCSLHSVCEAIWSGVETTFWGVKETPTDPFQLLNDSLDHREDFEVTSSNKYLLYFCATRCGESKVVADQLLKIWTNMEIIIKFWNKLLEQSFDNVKKGVTDPLSEAEISNFSFICFLVEPYLKKIETGKPMVPFIYT